MIRRWHRHHTASAHMMAQRRARPALRSFCRPSREFAAHRIIRVMKAFVLPETVHSRWDKTVLAQPSELRDLHIAELEGGQSYGK